MCCGVKVGNRGSVDTPVSRAPKMDPMNPPEGFTTLAFSGKELARRWAITRTRISYEAGVNKRFVAVSNEHVEFMTTMYPFEVYDGSAETEPSSAEIEEVTA